MISRFSILWLCALLSVAGCDCGAGKSEGSAEGSGANKKVFTYNRLAEHKSLDPVKQFDGASAELIMNLYDTLLEYHYLKRPYEMVPNLLTKMPELSEDGLTYTFELRSDVRFIDDECFPGGKGRALKSDDILYSLKRYASALNTRSYVLMQGSVAGMDEFRVASAKPGFDLNKTEIAGLKKIDDLHFTMTLTRRNPLALYPLAATQTSIVAREAVEHYGDNFENRPVGTGPFKMKSLQRRGVTVLERNPNYHGVYPSEGAPGDAQSGLLAAAGKKIPFVDEVAKNLLMNMRRKPLVNIILFLGWKT